MLSVVRVLFLKDLTTDVELCGDIFVMVSKPPGTAKTASWSSKSKMGKSALLKLAATCVLGIILR